MVTVLVVFFVILVLAVLVLALVAFRPRDTAEVTAPRGATLSRPARERPTCHHRKTEPVRDLEGNWVADVCLNPECGAQLPPPH